MSATTSTNIVPSIVFYGYLALLMQIRAVIAICFDLTGRQPFKINFYYVLPMLLLVSLRKRTAERRGQQNAWVWQTWRGYYSRVLSGIHLTLMFFALLQKDLFKGMWSLAEGFLKQNYCRACPTRGTLRSNDADDNENVKKTIGLNFARASHIFVHFFPVFARLRSENA